MLRSLRARLARLARTAEDFRDVAGPAWAPRVGAYMNAAHWLQHSLQEPSGPLLLLDLEGGPCHSPGRLANPNPNPSSTEEPLKC